MEILGQVGGGEFVAFSPVHWGALAAIAGAAVILSLLLRRGADRPGVRRGVCWGLAAVLLIGAVVAQIGRVIGGVWSLQESLPLHLCDIAVLTTAVALIGVGRRAKSNRASQLLYELACVWGLGGTSQALLTPDVTTAAYSPDCVRYFVLHGAIVVGVLVMTFGLHMRLQPGAPVRVWLVTLALAIVVGLVDWGLGANYMYLCANPARPSLFDLLGPRPWTLLWLAVVATGLILLCYAPFWIAARVARQGSRWAAH